ncbi:DNA-binding CsgD family transcriptional regulator [Microbacterium terrae]|uniref:HTH-type quorum sensing-dependent transcriptional regulator VjbR n=1 Tax=Microbacterium terrae TaxID=69369 RepID=A0A0M2HE45_9MICO|nr:LuxR C-terminal-related transcriptional regulator [Microbacterium terrae]KJL44909.1 HTH-type quorum sensing-dependent transcriptional regulator VjbR [Microbacterium terrae]MBP1076755.1 DNA-binding CsgD family transcriptional regulator [Microbacterium terrae]GLJ97586.1 helix-turn-helix transcriptional regulator [Microbacterium terrae]
MASAPVVDSVGADGAETVLARAVSELVRRTRFPVAFGGLERDQRIHVTSVVGARTRSLDGLVVEASRGLGGRALVEKRPRLTLDYGSSRSITHDYDRAVLGEGIATLFAVPVMVGARARGVIYCGSWNASPVGDVVARPAFAVAEELSTELRVRDEVERRVARIPLPSESGALSAGTREELRESYAELRSITAGIDDAALRGRLERLERRLAALSSPAPAAADEAGIRLSPRETDVLACAALGSTNAEIAAMLSIREGTVKSYLQSAMAKLDASTRHAAVATARRMGLLP